MKTIKLLRKVYNGRSCIFIRCEYDPIFDKLIRSYPGRIWSQSNRSWYIEDKEDSYRDILEYFRGSFKFDSTELYTQNQTFNTLSKSNGNKTGNFGIVEIKVGRSGGRIAIKFLGRYDKSWIDEIKQYGRVWYNHDKREWSMYASKIALDSISDYFNRLGVELRVIKPPEDKKITSERQSIGEEVRSRTLSESSQAAISLLKTHLMEKRFSIHTIETYTSMLTFFFKYYNNKPPSEITTEDVSEFMEEYVLKLEFSTSYQNQMINAIKTYYSLNGSPILTVEYLKRPQMGRPLPQVFSKEEVTRILSSPRNLKHKLILWMIYSCGLRRSEVINIKLSDISTERGILHIRSGKGNKDRVVPLPEALRPRLKEYLESYNPSIYLFEGQTGARYSATSVYAIFKQVMKQVGIKKEVGVHSLRHSYATHLHESGLDIRYIQELLGHSSSKTTEIYTHVSRRNLINVRSPLDDLDLH